MNRNRANSKGKILYNTIIRNINPKAFHLLTTNNIIKQNNINSFFPFSLSKSKSIVPFSTNTSRNQKNVHSKNSFEELLTNQNSERNSTIKNKSLLNTLLKQRNKSKSKSKTKRGISSKKAKISNLKNSSYLSNNEFIKNIILLRRKKKNCKNKVIKNKNNKSQSNYYNINYNSNISNNSKTRPNSIRCSLTYVNKYSSISRPEKPKLKYDDIICKTSNIDSYINKNKINELVNKSGGTNKIKKWLEIKSNLEDLKVKTMMLLNKYYFLSENLYNELEILNPSREANNKSYDYRKKFYLHEKNYD